MNDPRPLAPLGHDMEGLAHDGRTAKKIDPHGCNGADTPTPAPRWKNWSDVSREEVRTVSSKQLSARRWRSAISLPDTLIADAQALGMFPFELRFFAERGDSAGALNVEHWSTETLTKWARLYGMDRSSANRALADAVRRGFAGEDRGRMSERHTVVFQPFRAWRGALPIEPGLSGWRDY